MPANIPSPIVGAGGGGGQPWFEQLLLTLASQGPGVLMQWLENRQAGQQAQAIDTAAQSSLAGMAGSASPDEMTTLKAGGMNVAGPNTSTVGGNPSFKVVNRQADTSGMKSGVAQPLLSMMREGRTQGAQQAASGAQVRASDANTIATVAGNAREAELQPGRVAGQQEQILTSQAQRAQSAAELRLADQRAKNEAELLPIQVRQLQGQITANEADTRRANAETNTFATNMARQHRQEFTKVYGDLMTTFGMPGGTRSTKEAERIAARLVYGTDLPPKGTELDDYYKGVVAGGQVPDLYNVIKDRMMKELRVTPEQYTSILGMLSASGGDASVALTTAKTRGATMQELMRAAIIYSKELDGNVQLPIEIKSTISEFFKQLGTATAETPIGIVP